MPDLSSYMTTLRASGYWSDLYLSTFDEVAVLEGTVTADAADAAQTISFTGTSGSHTNVLPNMEVIVLTSGSVFKGRLRVAVGGSTSTVLQVNEFSPGRVKVVTGDKIRVMKSFRLRDLLVSNTLDFLKDSRLAYTDENHLVAPVANTGGLWVGFTSPLYEDPTAPVGHYGSLSYNLDPDSTPGADGTHLHSLASGAALDAGYADTDDDVVALYPLGTHIGRYAYTDADNSKASSKATLVRVHDDSDPPIPLRSARLSGSRRDGYSATFSAASGCGIEALPDGALVVLWKQEYRNHTLATSYGNKVSGRSHIKFVGFLIRDTVEVDPRTGTVTFDAVSPLEILRQMTGFTQALKHVTGDAANWQEFRGLSVKQMIVYLLRWHTTLFELFDFVWNVDGFYTYPELFMQKSTPADQVRELCDSLSSRLSCDRAGRFEINRNLQRGTSAERSAATVTMTLEAADRTGRLTVPTEHRYEVAQVEGLGFLAAYTVIPLKSIAPGEAPAEAPDYRVFERQIVDADDDNNLYLNLRTGHAFAEMNSLYDGLPVAKDVQVQLPPGYDVFDLGYEEYLKLPVDAATNPRGRAFASSERFLIERMEIEYNAGTGLETQTLTLAHETRGEPGITRDVLDESTPNPDGEPPFLADPTNPLSRGTANIAAFGSDNAAHLTANFTATPSYTEHALSVSGTITDFCADAYSPGYPGGGSVVGGAVDGVIATNEQLRRIDGIFGSRTLGTAFGWTHVSGTPTVQLHSERGVEGWFLASNTGGFGHDIAYSQDGGVTWAEVIGVDPHFDTFGGLWAAGLAVSPRVAGLAYTSVMDATGSSVSSSPTGRLKKTLDYGATWADLGISCGLMRAGAIHVPYQDESFTLVFHGYRAGTVANDWRLYRSLVGGASVDISPTYGGNAFGVDNNGHNRCICTSDTDMNTLLFIGTNAATGTRGLFMTRNALAATPTWNVLITPVAVASFPYVGMYSGQDRDHFYFFGAQMGLMSNGATIVNKTGNLSTGTVRGLCGKGA